MVAVVERKEPPRALYRDLDFRRRVGNDETVGINCLYPDIDKLIAAFPQVHAARKARQTPPRDLDPRSDNKNKQMLFHPPHVQKDLAKIYEIYLSPQSC